MATPQFQKAWDELSAVQREAANWRNQPILVIAGPGIGKNQSSYVPNRRNLDESPEANFRILGLTFTNKAADEMRARVESFIPDQKDRLFLGTFHSFCADVLRQHGTHLGINPNFQVYSQDSDLNALLADAVNKAMETSDIVRESDKKTLPVIKYLKSLLIPPDQVETAPIDAAIKSRLAIIYPAYERELNERNALDFDSLILRTHELFTRFPAFAKRYRTVYEYICIDEFQDTNRAQYQVIRALTGDQFINLFVVADDDQIIYQWNGASHKRLDELSQHYHPQVVQLPVNYRCPPEIVHLANNLISHNFLRRAGKAPLEASRETSGEDVVRLLGPFSDFDEEVSVIAQNIHKQYSGKLSSVAILARNRKLLITAKEALEAEGVLAVISQRRDEFESTPFAWLYAILRLANDRQDRRCLETVCGAFNQLTGIEVDPDEVVTQAKTANRDYLQYWLKNARNLAASDPSVLTALDKTSEHLSEGRNFLEFSKFALEWFDNLVQANSSSSTNSAQDVFVNYLEEREVWGQLRSEISSSLHRNPTLEAFLQELQMRSKEPPLKPNTVVLMTIHGAKGKEFDHVYLISLVDDELPSYQSKQKGSDSPEMEEERRNCFVAITRVAQTLTLSYSQRHGNWAKKPSRFLYEMGLLSDELE